MKGIFVAAVCITFALNSARAAEPSPARPNVILLLIDDLGWKDIGSYGGTVFKTPNIDRLAEQGMRFTNAYSAASVCAPTRASLITGKSPARLHFTALTGHHLQLGNVQKNPQGIKLIQPEITKKDGVQPEEFTIANAFREAGYSTALFGKTHFGAGGENLDAMGFDVHESPENDMWMTPPTIVETDPKRMTTITDRAIDFIKMALEKEKAFFLYLPHNAVHVQVQTTQSFYDAADARLTPAEKEVYSTHYVAMMDELDVEIGRLLAAVQQLGIADSTVFVLASDNGGVERVITKEPYKLTSMAPLRGQKGGQYEGSLRVPLIIHAPGVTAPGSVSNALTITADLYPTLLDLTGQRLRAEQHQDGVSLVPVLSGKAESVHDALFWHIPHYYVETPPVSSVRRGDFVYLHYWEKALSPYGGRAHELFDLSSDIGQSRNLIDAEPEKAAELRQLLLDHLTKIRAEIPQANPAFVPPSERNAR